MVGRIVSFLFIACLFSWAVASIEGCALSMDGYEGGPAEVKCPVGQFSVVGADGGPHCIIVGDYTNVVPGCHPVICQSYFDWGFYGDGGVGAAACAAACQSYCSDNAPLEQESRAEAKLNGLDCEY